MTAPSEIRGARRLGFTLVLFSAMGASTYTAASLAVVATFIIDDLGIGRAQFGLVIAANALLAALLSPVSGPIADRVGGKRAVIAVFAAAAVSYLALGLAAAFWMLFIGSFFGAWSMSGTNPATNKLIAEDLPQGERGVITGIKQSGVQAAIFLGGLALPSMAIAFGWRASYLMLATIPVLLALFAAWVVPASEPGAVSVRVSARAPLPSAIRWLGVYGLLLGFAGAVSYLVPLFGEEELGLDPRAAGAAAALTGLAAFAARIGWARAAEIWSNYRGPLFAMAVLAVVAAIAMMAAPTAGVWLLFVGALLIGISSSAWNSVGMLAVMDEAGAAATGRASGVVLLGFLAGLGIGPPIYGAIVDNIGYGVMWAVSLAAAAAAVVLMIVWHASLNRSERLRAS